jgi:hypothetical protein
MATVSFRPITVSFTSSARRGLRAFFRSVYCVAPGEGLVPVISLERSRLHADQSGATTTTRPGFVLGAAVVDSYENCHHDSSTLPRLASLEGMGFLIQLPPRAAILGRIDFDWQGDRLIALN